jgi:hypothetical protein
MSKSNFVNGDTLDATFVNKIFLTGHDHNGLDHDGSAPQIDLTSAVTNQLPDANISGVQANKIIGTLDLSTQTSGNPNVYVSTANYITGLDLTYNTTGGTYNVAPYVGACADSTNMYTLRLGVPFSGGKWDKNLINSDRTAALAWTAGAYGGCNYSTSLAAGWLNVFAIAHPPVSGTVAVADIGTDSDLTAANLLSVTGCTLYRRIGSILITGTSGSYSIAPFSAKNGTVTYLPQIDTTATETAGQVLTSVYTTIAAAIPPVPVTAKCLIKAWGGPYTYGYTVQDSSGLDCIKLSNNAGGVDINPSIVNIVDIGRSTSGITIKGSTGYSVMPTVAISVLGYTDYRGA